MKITPHELFYAIQMYTVDQLEVDGEIKVKITLNNDVVKGEILTESDIYEIEVTID